MVLFLDNYSQLYSTRDFIETVLERADEQAIVTSLKSAESGSASKLRDLAGHAFSQDDSLRGMFVMENCPCYHFKSREVHTGDFIFPAKEGFETAIVCFITEMENYLNKQKFKIMTVVSSNALFKTYKGFEKFIEKLPTVKGKKVFKILASIQNNESYKQDIVYLVKALIKNNIKVVAPSYKHQLYAVSHTKSLERCLYENFLQTTENKFAVFLAGLEDSLQRGACVGQITPRGDFISTDFDHTGFIEQKYLISKDEISEKQAGYITISVCTLENSYNVFEDTKGEITGKKEHTVKVLSFNKIFLSEIIERRKLLLDVASQKRLKIKDGFDSRRNFAIASRKKKIEKYEKQIEKEALTKDGKGKGKKKKETSSAESKLRHLRHRKEFIASVSKSPDIFNERSVIGYPTALYNDPKDIIDRTSITSEEINFTRGMPQLRKDVKLKRRNDETRAKRHKKAFEEEGGLKALAQKMQTDEIKRQATFKRFKKAVREQLNYDGNSEELQSDDSCERNYSRLNPEAVSLTAKSKLKDFVKKRKLKDILTSPLDEDEASAVNKLGKKRKATEALEIDNSANKQPKVKSKKATSTITSADLQQDDTSVELDYIRDEEPSKSEHDEEHASKSQSEYTKTALQDNNVTSFVEEEETNNMHARTRSFPRMNNNSARFKTYMYCLHFPKSLIDIHQRTAQAQPNILRPVLIGQKLFFQISQLEEKSSSSNADLTAAPTASTSAAPTASTSAARSATPSVASSVASSINVDISDDDQQNYSDLTNNSESE